ncbi:MAG: formimidoylglutamate deiminase [Pseudomonadota bacterium]
MTRIHARQALLPSGWADNVEVHVGEDGRIASVNVMETTTGDAVPPERSGEWTRVDTLLPAPVNAHSHAFQRAMAGLTERRGPDLKDTFWTWRELMFRFLDQLTPDDVEAITAFVQMEMLECGYATSVEFHYLHHCPDGQPYDALAEMSERIVAAAAISGIGLTLLPVHYQYGGCDRRPLRDGQRRFGTDLDQYARLLDGANRSVASLAPDAGTGVAPHSLRAVAKDAFSSLAALAEGRPIHLHLAEQIAEVDELVASYGKRPVEWVLDTLAPDEQWCMIHCTQMLPHETEGLARSGAIAGLCPITEANLGDGNFDGSRWLSNGGALAIGSDSNVRISLAEELRMLEYSQRLRDHSRAALATSEQSTGRRLFDAALAGGTQAAGRDCGKIAPGGWADLMTLDSTSVDLDGRRGDLILDSFIFAGDDGMVRDVWSAGRHRVREGKHTDRLSIELRYRETMRQLSQAL